MLLIKSLDQWFTYEHRELWKETHEHAAITTEIFIKNNKKNPLNSLTRITCVETLSLPSLGQPPFSMRARSLLDHHIKRTEQIQGMARTSRMGARAHSATMSPLGTLYLKYVFNEIRLQSCKRGVCRLQMCPEKEMLIGPVPRWQLWILRFWKLN